MNAYNAKYVCVLVFLFILEIALAHAESFEVPEYSARINEFTINLVKHYGYGSDAPKNTILSPQSIYHGLAMSYIASAGITRQEMAHVIHFPEDNEQLLEDLLNLRQQFLTGAQHEQVNMSMANSIWMDTTYADFQKAYMARVEQVFEEAIHYVQFKRSDQTSEDMNLWISEKTNGTIQKSVRPEDFISKSRPGIIEEPGLVVINAVCFQAPWGSKFDAESTDMMPFHIDEATTEDAMMMHQNSLLLYSEDEDVKFLEIPYIDASYSMYFILPQEVLSVGELMDLITEKRIATLKRKAYSHKVDVLLPKFTMHGHLDMKHALTEMGVEQAFDSQKADFDKMIKKKIQAFRIYISQILHDGYIEVNEEGTEAAAATTTIHYSFGCSAPPPPVAVDFHADHPFLFLIVHNESRSILFAGWLSDPGEL
jgi:serpin B